MRISDEECEELRQQCRDIDGVDMTIDEVRDGFSRVLLLLERFGLWVAKEMATGRIFETDEARTTENYRA